MSDDKAKSGKDKKIKRKVKSEKIKKERERTGRMVCLDSGRGILTIGPSKPMGHVGEILVMYNCT
jgi:hypothetical protein